MKKVVSLFVLLLCLACLLCACDPGHYTIQQEILDQEVGIELIQYDNPDQKHFVTWVPDQFDKLAPFDLSRATVLETLNKDKIQDFLASFAEKQILSQYYAHNSPKNICLRLWYENGDFLIIWSDYERGNFAGYIGEYLADGTVLSFWGCFSALASYETLVDEFFTHPLE